MEEKWINVGQLNTYINKKLKSDSNLKNIYVKGEISNYKEWSSGHSYFKLKDKDSQIDAVMFKGRKKSLMFKPSDGMEVIAKGSVEVYLKNGSYKLYVSEMTQAGLGDLHIAFEQLKKKLKKEGLFNESHKKEIPKYPKKIGVITAKTGAAIKDIITTINRRYPQCEILIFSTLVQGSSAAPQIVSQIKHAQDFDIDILIVGRGGGSIEDLWPFNEEIVARSIYECEIPVISAVGHEIDYTISDFVADLRAPTPTAAAELAVPEIKEMEFKLNQYNQRLNKCIFDEINNKRDKIKNITEKSIFKKPESIYEIKEMNLDTIISKLEFASKNIINENKNRLFRIKNHEILKNPQYLTKDKKERYLKNVEKLEILNPLLTLKRGYTLTKKDEKIVSSKEDVKKDDKLKIEFSDGTINTKVI